MRIREEHGAKLLAELEAAFSAADVQRAVEADVPRMDGGYVEVELRPGTNPAVLERKREGIRPGATKDEGDISTVALYVPDHARAALVDILEATRKGPLTAKGQRPPRSSGVDPIEAFRQAHLKTFWTDDPQALPDDPQHEMWWAVWTHPDKEQGLDAVCERLGVRAAGEDRRLHFPEAVVVPVWARRAAIELMTFVSGVVDELRRATDSPKFFVDDVRDAQHDWSDDLAERIVWPGTEVPAVCLFDTGVNRGHALLEPALAPADLHAIDAAWGVDDHANHGTPMAGLALHGDLTAQLADRGDRVLTHRLESVKLLPPAAMPANDPESYGVLTQAAWRSRRSHSRNDRASSAWQSQMTMYRERSHRLVPRSIRPPREQCRATMRRPRIVYSCWQ